jgi:hypothetical protein
VSSQDDLRQNAEILSGLLSILQVQPVNREPGAGEVALTIKVALTMGLGDRLHDQVAIRKLRRDDLQRVVETLIQVGIWHIIGQPRGGR